jgi:hypothetical protein
MISPLVIPTLIITYFDVLSLERFKKHQASKNYSDNINPP